MADVQEADSCGDKSTNNSASDDAIDCTPQEVVNASPCDNLPDTHPDAKETADSGFKIPVAIGTLPKKDSNESKSSEVVKTVEKIVKVNQAKKPSKQAFSPAERIQQSNVPLPYLEPPWSGLCDTKYYLEVLKNGQIIDNIYLNERPFYVFGRLASCDIQMEHPSLSRHHAVLQYCAKPDNLHPLGWYMYDLESTHGTLVNKIKLRPRSFTRARVGHVIKFGGSTRLYVLQGPDEDQDEEKPMSSRKTKENSTEEEEPVEGVSGCLWGIGEDAKEEAQPLFDASKNEGLYINDPKKCLKNIFEREGFDLPEYDCDEDGFNRFKCSIELPMLIDDVGAPTVVSTSISGKKKEAVIACALEACRLLDLHGELRKSQTQGRERKARDWQSNDYYSSEEDEFLDRTGDIQRKRTLRRKLAGVEKNETKTYPELAEDLRKVQEELADIEKKLQQAKEAAAEFTEKESGLDALDAYMNRIKSGSLFMDTKTRMTLKKKQLELKHQAAKLSRLVQLTKPAELPTAQKKEVEASSAGPKPAVFGQRKWMSIKIPKPAVVQKTSPVKTVQPEVEEDEEEEEDDDDITQEKGSNSEEGEQTAPRTTERQHNMDILADSEEKTKSHEKDSFLDSEEMAESSSGTEKHLKTETEKTVLSGKPAESTAGQTSQDMKGSGSSAGNNTKRVGTDTNLEFVSANPKSSQSKKTKRKGSTLEFMKRAAAKIPKTIHDVDPTYQTWLPPTDQEGDGKTRLNEKLGY